MSADRSNDSDAETDARHQAVALRYASVDTAPRVVAKGYGDMADAIIARAREHGLYVHAEPELVRLLAQVDLDAHIPPTLYVAVAELLAWVYELERAALGGRGETRE